MSEKLEKFIICLIIFICLAGFVFKTQKSSVVDIFGVSFTIASIIFINKEKFKNN